MQYNFYDTCALLNYGDSIFGTGEKFYISNLTLREIEGIKTAFNKDADVKYKARKLAYNLIVFKDDY